MLIMNFTLLRYFSVVAETRHMTKASKMLNISQPSLTSGIKRLENELGVELFDRSTRNMELNEYGRIFLEHTKIIEQEYLEATRRINSMKQLKEKHLTLCIPSSPAKHDLAEILIAQSFSLNFRNLPENWQQALLDGKLDCVATLELFSSSRLERTVLRHNEVVIIASKTHPLALKGHCTVDEINEYPLSSNSTEHSALACAKNKIAALGIIPNVSFYTNGIRSVIDSVRTSNRLAFLVREHLPDDADIAFLNCEGFNVRLPLYLYLRRDNRKADMDKAVSLIKQYYNSTKDPALEEELPEAE